MRSGNQIKTVFKIMYRYDFEHCLQLRTCRIANGYDLLLENKCVDLNFGKYLERTINHLNKLYVVGTHSSRPSANMFEA